MKQHIVKLEIRDFKGIRNMAVDLDPSHKIIYVSGPNRAGKTSFMDALAYLLEGPGKTEVKKIVRNGAREAKIQAWLGNPELSITRTIGESGKKLTIRDASGTVLKSPQNFLNGLFSQNSVNLMNVIGAGPREQLELAKRYAGLDTSGLEQQVKELYDRRTLTNSMLEKARAKLGGRAVDPAVALEPVTITGLIEELNAATEKQRKQAEDADRLARLRGSQKQLADEIARLREAIKGIERTMESNQAEIKALESAPREDPGVEAIREKISLIEVTNEKIRQNNETMELKKQVDDLESETKFLTAGVELARRQIVDARKSVDLKVEGLEIGDECLLYRGVPLPDCSETEKIMVAVSLALCDDPELPVVLIPSGSGLLPSSVEEIARQVEERGAHLFIEQAANVRPDGGSEIIFIESGELSGGGY